MTEPVDPEAPDPHDPLAPRFDDPWIGRWWWARRLYRRTTDRPLFFRWPVMIVLMVLAIGFLALGVVLLVRAV